MTKTRAVRGLWYLSCGAVGWLAGYALQGRPTAALLALGAVLLAGVLAWRLGR